MLYFLSYIPTSISRSDSNRIAFLQVFSMMICIAISSGCSMESNQSDVIFTRPQSADSDHTTTSESTTHSDEDSVVETIDGVSISTDNSFGF